MPLSSRVQNMQYGPTNQAGRTRTVPPRVLLQKGPVQGLEQMGRQENRVQQSIAQATGAIKSFPLSGGNMLDDIVLVSGVNVVKHYLRSPQNIPQAWKYALLMNQTAAYGWFFSNTADHPASEYILVTAGGPMTCSLYVK